MTAVLERERGGSVDRAVALAFFGSGLSALVFETLWFHQAALAFGSSVWASSLVLSAFMAGLALGGAIVAQRGERIANPLRFYAALELAIAVSGVLLVYGLPAFGALMAPRLLPLAEHAPLLHGARLVLAFLLLLVPSTAMGMTLPLLVRALAGKNRDFGRVLGLLYGMNTLGAVVGVTLTETVLVAAFGIRASAYIAGAVNLVAGGIAFALAPRAQAAFSERSRAEPAAPRDAAVRRLLGAAFLAGFVLLGLEVVWLRLLGLFLNGTSLAFSMVLASVLAGIALGGLGASGWLTRRPEAHRHLPAVALFAGVLGILGFGIFPYFVGSFLTSGSQGAWTIVGVCLPLVFPVSLTSGALFTLIGAALRARVGSDSRTAGALAAYNTVGSALGSLVAGFVALPSLGMERALFAMLCAYGLIAALTLERAELRRKSTLVAAVALAAALALFPFGYVRDRFIAFSAKKWATSPDDELVAVREGLDATLMYVAHHALGTTRHHQLLTNAYSMSTTAWSVRRYMKLYVYFPLAVRPVVKNALVIGFGVGNTTQALVHSREIETIDVVDISRDILELSRVVYPDPARHPLRDPRVSVHVDDGRWYLLGSTRRFDLITGEPPPHHLAGVSNLYSAEYFRLLRDRLNDGGVVTYWLHAGLLSEKTAKAILAAFCGAFPDCSLWHGSGIDFMLLGTKNLAGPLDENTFTRQWRDPAVLPELRALGIEKPEQLGALFIADSATLSPLSADAPPAADDFPHRLLLDPSDKLVDALIEAWRDEALARQRFTSSALIARLWPPALKERTLGFFDHQHLLNDLLFRKPSFGFSKDLATLDRALRDSDLELPPLLLLQSDPDLQRVLASVEATRPDDPDVVRHRAVGLLAKRDFPAAEQALRRLEKTRYATVATSLLRFIGDRGAPAP